MKVAWFVTPVALAAIVVLFAATWLTIPAGPYEVKNSTSGHWQTKRVDYPARLFRRGLVERVERGDVYRSVDLNTLRMRVEIVYSSLAAIVLLIGLAFALGIRRPTAAGYSRPQPELHPGRLPPGRPPTPAK